MDHDSDDTHKRVDRHIVTREWAEIVAEVVQMEQVIENLSKAGEFKPVPSLVDEANRIVDVWRGVA